MTDDLTPAGTAAVRLAGQTARLKRERDRARDVAAGLEQRLAAMESRIVARAAKFDRFAEFTASTDDAELYRAIANDIRGVTFEPVDV